MVIGALLFHFNVLCQNMPPEITATGNQTYCPLSQIPIVTDFSIVDVDDTTIETFYIQISSGYESGSDVLILTGTHSSIEAEWDDREGKLTLRGVGGIPMLFSDLERAVREVVFESTNPDVSGVKDFSLTTGNANFLPSNQHYYEFVPNIGVSWTEAKMLAEDRMYFGLQGYLATVTSREEAAIVGEQSKGAGWIGGTDEEEEGVWKWATGPEAGAVFWNGGVNGTTPNFAFWNHGEPNNAGGNEDYAHITDDSVGVIGSWNDLPLNGDSGVYEPKGYIVEYGGRTGDPVLNISASTMINVGEIGITSITEGESCSATSVMLSASSSEGVVLWYDTPAGGNLVNSGNVFTTPTLTNTTTYYVTTSEAECSGRIPVRATINELPSVVNVENGYVCGSPGSVVLEATASEGTINWYDSLTSTTPIFSGNSLEVTISVSTTYYVEVESLTGCVSATRTPVEAVVENVVPDFDVEEELFICVNEGMLTIAASNPLGIDYSYVWTNEEGNVLVTENTLSVVEAGNYFVQATSRAGCKSEIKKIEVKASEIASLTAESLIISDDTENNSILILTDQIGVGSYEYAVDNENYTSSNFYENLLPGIHTLNIRDKNGCGVTSVEFSVFNYPTFFTPNGDGVKDSWKIDGFRSNEYAISKIVVFDRYGKLLFENSGTSENWDGRYNGKELPSGSYWYLVEVTDKNGRKIHKKGAVGLLRK
ncbi:conserved hypothetical protein [Tenacibaculum amylolyticum]